ncbi:MAG: hypothetical protein NTZ35_00850 [Ignavibacteriales bacterium]|nr:hypothetical protein [Ignavibacteriales bacterium]
MPDNENKSLDLLGVKPIAESVSIVTKATVDGISAFLSRICLPAAEEFGLLLRDKVSTWRANNAAKIAIKAEKKLNTFSDAGQRHAHPRLVMTVLENGSWSDNDEVQEFWAGLLAASCTQSGDDDSNMIFINLLSQLTLSEVRLFAHFCLTTKKIISPVGSIAAVQVDISLQDLKAVSRIDDFHRIDRELDHLRALGLIDGGFHVRFVQCFIAPTTLALQMYARCNGTSEDPAKFYGLASV